MTLWELSLSYADSAEAIRQRIRQLQEQLLDSMDEAESEALRRRILELQPLLRETRETGRRIAHYYDRTVSGGVYVFRYF